jgi:hypothetical protein
MKTDPILITFKGLRQAVGWLGIFLPIVLAVLLYALTSCCVQDSISMYYYTRMGSYLTGTLCAVGLFLFAYKGYPGENDSKLCNFAAVCAFGVAFIPMQLNKVDVPCPDCIVYFTNGDHWWRVFHFVSAGLLFFTMGYMSLFKFTKTHKEKISKEEQKYKRNILYRVCGIIIFACILFMIVYSLIKHFKPDMKVYTLTFYVEALMLIAFGTAWLVKGEGIKYLNDKP